MINYQFLWTCELIWSRSVGCRSDSMILYYFFILVFFKGMYLTDIIWNFNNIFERLSNNIQMSQNCRILTPVRNEESTAVQNHRRWLIRGGSLPKLLITRLLAIQFVIIVQFITYNRQFIVVILVIIQAVKNLFFINSKKFTKIFNFFIFEKINRNDWDYSKILIMNWTTFLVFVNSCGTMKNAHHSFETFDKIFINYKKIRLMNNYSYVWILNLEYTDEILENFEKFWAKLRKTL